MLHIPILRRGVPYRSVDTTRTVHYKTREPFVEISQANVGLIRRDLLRQEESRDALASYSTRELIAMCGRAAELFLNGTLPIGDEPQTPQNYVEQLSATTGMPWVLVRRNMTKIHSMMSNMETVLAGLSRGLDFAVLDQGYSGPLSYFPRGLSMGVVLPSNSPGVHSLWIPAIRAEDAAGAEAGKRGTVDALSDYSGAAGGRMPAGGAQLLSDRPRGVERDSAVVRTRHVVW